MEKINWQLICVTSEDEYGTSWTVEYNKEKGMYRVSLFENNHWKEDVVFDEIEKEE